MREVFNKSYFLCWIPIPLLLLIGFFDKGVFDINIHDTYYIITNNHFLILISIILFIDGLGYWLLKKKNTIRWMIIFHVSATFISILIFTIYLLKSIYGSNLLIYTIFLFVFAQFIYLINIFISTIRNKNKNLKLSN